MDIVLFLFVSCVLALILWLVPLVALWVISTLMRREHKFDFANWLAVLLLLTFVGTLRI